MDLSRYSSVVELPVVKDEEVDFKQHVLDYVRGVMEHTFSTDVWYFEYEAVPMFFVLEPEATYYCSHIRFDCISGKAWLYDDDFEPEACTSDYLDDETFKALEAYFKEKESEAKSRGVVEGILVSDYVARTMLPYRGIGDYRVMPPACADYFPRDPHVRIVPTDAFYFSSDADLLNDINRGVFHLCQ